VGILENAIPKLKTLGTMLISPGSTFSLPELAFALLVAFTFLVIRHRRRRGRARFDVVARAVLARRVIFNRSTYADLIYFLINTLALGGLIGWGLLSARTISNAEIATLTSHFGARAPSSAPDWALRATMTGLLFLAYEFGYWFDHYLKHRIPALWELHKTHHTAEVLTPVTVFRVHPLDTLIFTNIQAIVVGATAGLSSYLFAREAPIYSLDGVNIVLVVFVWAYVHLQHSQFWIPFTGALGRVFMSPAHHQIHHSTKPEHFNRNLGSCLAIWDWLFGTLERPQKDSPRLRFGVEEPGVDQHSLMPLLVEPVVNALAALLGRPAGAAAPAPAAAQTAEAAESPR
jgi:sterol desaturase/sphingolipid hydroxylase (fatty acid hydroxylase superfamily)